MKDSSIVSIRAMGRAASSFLSDDDEDLVMGSTVKILFYYCKEKLRTQSLPHPFYTLSHRKQHELRMARLKVYKIIEQQVKTTYIFGL